MPATVSAPRRWLIVVLALAIAVVCGYSLGVRTSKPAIGALPMKTALAAFNRSATASATSPTTSPDPCSRPAASGRDYTLNPDEPH